VLPGVGKVIEFVKQAFAATEVYVSRRPDGTVMHAQVKIGDSVIMMGEPQGGGKNFPAMLMLYVENVDAVYQRAIQADAKSLREPDNQFYGDRSGLVEDALGNQWWIATHVEDVSPEELDRRMQGAMA
jgi:PhnB protein